MDFRITKNQPIIVADIHQPKINEILRRIVNYFEGPNAPSMTDFSNHFKSQLTQINSELIINAFSDGQRLNHQRAKSYTLLFCHFESKQTQSIFLNAWRNMDHCQSSIRLAVQLYRDLVIVKGIAPGINLQQDLLSQVTLRCHFEKTKCVDRFNTPLKIIIKHTPSWLVDLHQELIADIRSITIHPSVLFYKDDFSIRYDTSIPNDVTNFKDAQSNQFTHFLLEDEERSLTTKPFLFERLIHIKAMQNQPEDETKSESSSSISTSSLTSKSHINPNPFINCKTIPEVLRILHPIWNECKQSKQAIMDINKKLSHVRILFNKDANDKTHSYLHNNTMSRKFYLLNKRDTVYKTTRFSQGLTSVYIGSNLEATPFITLLKPGEFDLQFKVTK